MDTNDPSDSQEHKIEETQNTECNKEASDHSTSATTTTATTASSSSRTSTTTSTSTTTTTSSSSSSSTSVSSDIESSPTNQTAEDENSNESKHVVSENIRSEELEEEHEHEEHEEEEENESTNDDVSEEEESDEKTVDSDDIARELEMGFLNENEEQEGNESAMNQILNNVIFQTNLLTSQIAKKRTYDLIQERDLEIDSELGEEGSEKAINDEKMANFISNLTDKELERFEAYRRSSIPRSKMRKLLNHLTGQTINDEKVLIVVCSMAKMFVGELIENSRKEAVKNGETGPLTRDQVYKAFKNMEKSGAFKKTVYKDSVKNFL